MTTSTDLRHGWLLDTGLLKPVSLNDRMHHMVKWRLTKPIRRNIRNHARALHIPPQAFIHVQLEYTPKVNRRRDSDNLQSTAKPAVDGLVDAGVIPDDTAEYVTRHEPVFLDKDPSLRGNRLFLRVWVEGA